MIFWVVVLVVYSPLCCCVRGRTGNDIKNTASRNQAQLIFEAMDILAHPNTTTTPSVSTTLPPSTPATQLQKERPSDASSDMGAADFHDLIYSLVRNMQVNATHIQNSVKDAVDAELPSVFEYHDKTLRKKLLPELDSMIHTAIREELAKHDQQVDSVPVP